MYIKKYFENRNKELIIETTPEERNILGFRDVETFKNLHEICFDCAPSFAGKLVVDVGAGDKFIERPLRQLGAKYHPIDADDLDLNSEYLPFSDDSVDFVIMLAVIEHISEIDHLMTEVKRVLKKNGVLYITTPNFKYCFRDFYNDPTHIRPFTEVSLKKLVEMYLFESVRVFPGLRCKPRYMYTRNNAFKKAARIPFIKKHWFLPDWLYGRATSIALLARK